MPNILNYLQKKNFKHEILEHKLVYTALDLANTLRRKLDDVAKSLLVKVDKKYMMVILPASKNLNLKKLKALLVKQGFTAKIVELPAEKIVKKALKLGRGGVSAFGSVYKLPVIMEKSLAIKQKMVCSLGNFRKSAEVAVKDFLALEKPILGVIGEAKKRIASLKKAKTAAKTNTKSR